MDAPIFSGLGLKLQRVLQALDISNFEDPVWNLKEKRDKIYLDICWLKTKIPATEVSQPASRTTPVNDLEQTNRATVLRSGQGSDIDSKSSKQVDPNVYPSQQITKRKKRKSPSTQKRDKKRLAKWLASKNSAKNSTETTPANAQPDAEPVKPSIPTEAESPVSVDNLDSNCNSVSEIPHKSDTQEQTSSPKRSACEVCFNLDCLDLACIDEEAKTRTGIDVPAVKQRIKHKLSHCYNPDCKIPASKVPGGLKKCTRCHVARYCSRDCQGKHWKAHKGSCAAYVEAQQSTN